MSEVVWWQGRLRVLACYCLPLPAPMTLVSIAPNRDAARLLVVEVPYQVGGLPVRLVLVDMPQR